MSKYRIDRETGEVYAVDADLLVFKRATLYIMTFELVFNSLLVAGVLGYGYATEQNAAYLIEAFFTLPVEEQNSLGLNLLFAEGILIFFVSALIILILQRKKSEIVDDWK